MKIHRTIIHPKTPADLVVHLPELFLKTETEIIAISVSDSTDDNQTSFPVLDKKRWEDALAFWNKHTVDFSKLKKWKREDLYE
jgi:hypothetical protein